MIISFPRWSRTFLRLLSFAVLTVLCGAISSSRAASPKAPTLLSQSDTSTRAIALESVTFKGEPFPLTSSVQFSADPRTRVCIFATNMELLPGEGLNAFSAEAQDSAGIRYALTVEYVGQVPPAVDGQGNITSDFRGISMIVVRLNDAMGDVGDVLLRLNLHGMSSNQVRLGIGHVGGTLPSDAVLGLVPTPAPVTPPPPDQPVIPDPYTGPSTDSDTVRFLEQATWGPTRAEIDRVKTMQGGFRAYLDEQFNSPVANPSKGSNYPDLQFPPDDLAQPGGCPTGSPAECGRDKNSMYPLQRTFYTNSLYGQDQLRQRVAFALHQIFVVSGFGLPRPSWMTVYLQALDRGAFGNFRTLLSETTLNPEMGEYLDMRLSTRTNQNENFPREILQLFSIGTVELNIDGTPKLDTQGVPIPSYSQTTVNEFTRLFTGWELVRVPNPPFPFAGTTNYRDPMVPRAGNNHDAGAKTLLNGVTIPACVAPNTNQQCAQLDLTAGLDNIFNHPNVGPFIGKQLIQHLVTSNPSRAYVQRVARVFNNDCDALYPAGCTNVRGNLKAVVQAILLDPEARGDVKTDPNYGKLREPAQYVNNILRAFNAKSFDKTSTSDGVLGQRSADFAGTLDQPIFLPTTVFSYYQPEYEVPGTKILGPAFGILSTSTTLRRANVVNTLVYTGVTANTTPVTSPDRPRGTSLDLANLEAIAVNPGPAAIADQLNALLLHGTMSTQMRTSLINAMNTIPTTDANVARKRAQTAVYLVATSSQYDIQR